MFWCAYLLLGIGANGADLPRADFFNLEGYAKLKSVPNYVRLQVEQELQSSHFAFNSHRTGQATDTHNCGTISSVPNELTFITKYDFYRKYTQAYGIPVVSSAAVSDDALKRACYIVRFLFADRKDVRNSMYKNYGRVGVIAINEQTTTIPEFSHLPKWWDTRARGLGGVLGRPISTAGEENLLCLRNDRYRGDDIFLHEASHGVAEVAIKGGGIPGYYDRLLAQFNAAKRQGLWRNTYSMTDSREYFAEGMQSFFNCHVEADPPNGIHNEINTRTELKAYDPGLYNLIKEVYPCMNTYYTCDLNASDMKMNCDNTTGGTTVAPTSTNTPQTNLTTSQANCYDNSQHCPYWARQGYCTSGQHARYMRINCKTACSLC